FVYLLQSHDKLFTFQTIFDTICYEPIFVGKGGNMLKVCEKEMTNEQLEHILHDDEATFLLLDVRETTEYALQHIPGSVLIPLGQLEDRLEEISNEYPIYIICRSGARSHEACSILNAHGYDEVFNVIPGMIGWEGIVESDFA